MTDLRRCVSVYAFVRMIFKLGEKGYATLIKLMEMGNATVIKLMEKGNATVCKVSVMLLQLFRTIYQDTSIPKTLVMDSSFTN